MCLQYLVQTLCEVKDAFFFLHKDFMNKFDNKKKNNNYVACSHSNFVTTATEKKKTRLSWRWMATIKSLCRRSVITYWYLVWKCAAYQNIRRQTGEMFPHLLIEAAFLNTRPQDLFTNTDIKLFCNRPLLHLLSSPILQKVILVASHPRSWSKRCLVLFLLRYLKYTILTFCHRPFF